MILFFIFSYFINFRGKQERFSFYISSFSTGMNSFILIWLITSLPFFLFNYEGLHYELGHSSEQER